VIKPWHWWARLMVDRRSGTLSLRPWAIREQVKRHIARMRKEGGCP
jgi:hypothetical protein